MLTESDLAFFVLLARKGGFRAAALELGVSPPAVSKRLAKIEDRLGVRLLNRTTRRVSMTSEGDAYFAGALRVLQDIDDLNRAVVGARSVPRGLLRVNATFGFGREHIASVVSEFAKLYPEVEVQLVLSNAPFNLVEEGFDLGIWFGRLPNSRLIARKLHTNRRFMCASPEYLETYGVPKTLSDIEEHSCVVLRQDTGAHDVWRFQHKNKDVSVRVRGSLSSNDGEIALGWVLEGHGIMVRAEWDIARHLRAGKLRKVLPTYVQRDADIFAVYPTKHNLSAKVSTFVEFLANALKQRFGVEE